MAGKRINTNKGNAILYPISSEFRKSITISKVPRFRPFVLLIRVTRQSKWVWAMVEWWNGSNGRKKLIQWHFVHHKSHTDFAAMETESRWWEAGDWPTEQWRGLILKYQTEIYLQAFSPYRAVNTFHLGYKKQSVYAVSGTSRCLFSDKYKTHKYSVSRTYSCWMLNCWCITWPVGCTRLIKQNFNPLNTKRRPLYLKAQSVPRCKHFSSGL